MRRKVLLLSPAHDESEMLDLLSSLRWDVVGLVTQRMKRQDPAHYFGSGKLEEAREAIEVLTKESLATKNREIGSGRRGATAAGSDTTGGRHGSAADEEDLDAYAHGVFEADDKARTRKRVERAPRREWGMRERKKKPSRRQRALVDKVTAVVDAELKPSQVAQIEKLLGGVDVFDRTRIILEIFQERARNEEARLQVEAARLRYEMPLVREYIRLARVGEHPGFMAGGEYGVNQYFDTIQSRLTKVNRELDNIAREREARRKHRRRGGFFLVSLAGYTNAGKSSLMKSLSGEDVLIENRMFSTLDTKTARLTGSGGVGKATRGAKLSTPRSARPGDPVGGPRLEGAGVARGRYESSSEPKDNDGPDSSRERKILVTDTVGFIRDLPPFLIKAFRSTLEEIALSDLIVLVVDASEHPSEMLEKFAASHKVLLGFESIPPIVIAMNKCDLIESDAARDVRLAALTEGGVAMPASTMFTSAATGEGVRELAAAIEERAASGRS